MHERLERIAPTSWKTESGFVVDCATSDATALTELAVDPLRSKCSTSFIKPLRNAWIDKYKLVMNEVENAVPVLVLDIRC